ncbi:MAG: T9SS type A sorting domain-containing protein [Bacteroidota bacterium]
MLLTYLRKTFLLACLFGFGLGSLNAQTSPENIDYLAAAGGAFGSNVNAEFAVALNPDILFPAVPVAAEFTAIMYIPTASVTGNESFTVLDDNTNGGSMIFQGPGFAHTDGNTYFSFVYSGSGINLSAFGTGSFVLAFSVDVANGNAGVNWEIADATTGLFADFAIRSSLNVSGFNELLPTRNAPLPVEMASFEAYPKDDQQVNLVWTTASELNNDYFTVERSKDGQQFEAIGEVEGAKNSEVEQSYFFVDTEPTAFNYYRIKQTDLNGAFTHSEVRQVSFKQKAELKVFPNPAQHQVSISLGDSAFEGSLSLYDASGRLLLEAFPGQEDFPYRLSINNLPDGIYWLRAVSNGQAFSERLVIAPQRN